MNQPASIVSFDNIHKTYLLGVEGVAALRGVKLEIFEGEFIVIFGPSGCGKSSLLNILGTIDTPTKGNLTLFDSSITDRTRDEALAGMRSRHIGFVFQNFNLLSTMDAVENVALPMTITIVSRSLMFSSRRMFITLSAFVVSKSPVGSSRRRSLGSFASARAIVTRCCSPPDNIAGKCVSL